MTTEDIERIVKLYHGTTDNDIRRIILKLLEIEVVKRGAIVTPTVTPGIYREVPTL